MDGSDKHDQELIRQVVSQSALLALQFAASRAEIGNFARRDLATPQAAARSYRTTLARLAPPRLKVA
jgi:hypothetical protein